MPAFFTALLLKVEAAGVELLRLLGRDDTDLVVLATQRAAAVGDRVNMKLRRRRLSR